MAVGPEDGPRLAGAAAAVDVPAARLGAAGGDELRIELAGSSLQFSADALALAWEAPF